MQSSDEEGKKSGTPLTPEAARQAAEEEHKKELAEKQAVVMKEGDYQIQVHLIEVRCGSPEAACLPGFHSSFLLTGSGLAPS